MSKPRNDRQKDLFRPSLDQITDLEHPMVRLTGEIDWEFLSGRCSSVCAEGSGQPPLPTRLVAGLLILKHMHGLSDEALSARWLENPYFQHLCGEERFQHRLPFDRSSLTRWRQRLGEEQLATLIQESLSVADKTGALEARDLERVAVDTCQYRLKSPQKLRGKIPQVGVFRRVCPRSSPAEALAAGRGAGVVERPAGR